MSTYSCQISKGVREYTGDSSEKKEEEELVRRVGGRGRSLIQAVLRVRRERAGRIPPNWLGTQNMQSPGQEVGSCGQEERRLGGFQARDIRSRTKDDGPWTDDLHDNRETERQRQRIR